MCEINPKRRAVFKLEIFTAHDITDSAWAAYVYNTLTLIEQFLNRRGEIRVHIHESEDPLQGVRVDVNT